MQLLYFKADIPNFGDDLNAVIWPRLAPGLFDAGGGSFLGIGTIIGMLGAGARNVHVFSSGAGYTATDRAAMAAWKFWCVRGPLSAHLLGLDPDTALTDGAILAPAVLPAPKAGRRGIVVVPHWETLLADESGGLWPTACALAGMTLVDPRQPPAQVVPMIAGASLVLAESLHGAIIADTYGVPWIAFATSANISMFKWLDWARSVGVTLRVHLVQPPQTALLHRLGRPAKAISGGTAWGACVVPDEAAAMAEFRRRTAASVAAARMTMRARLKARLDGSPRLQSLLGYSPPATAAALTRLAKAESSLSHEAPRRRLTERMTGRLDALVREQTLVRAEPRAGSSPRRSPPLHSSAIVARP